MKVHKAETIWNARRKYWFKSRSTHVHPNRLGSFQWNWMYLMASDRHKCTANEWWLTWVKNWRLILKNPLQKNAISKLFICDKHSCLAKYSALSSTVPHDIFSMHLINCGSCIDTNRRNVSEQLMKKNDKNQTTQTLQRWHDSANTAMLIALVNTPRFRPVEKAKILQSAVLDWSQRLT